jgi:hypothetical protein
MIPAADPLGTTAKSATRRERPVKGLTPPRGDTAIGQPGGLALKPPNGNGFRLCPYCMDTASITDLVAEPGKILGGSQKLDQALNQ